MELRLLEIWAHLQNVASAKIYEDVFHVLRHTNAMLMLMKGQAVQALNHCSQEWGRGLLDWALF